MRESRSPHNLVIAIPIPIGQRRQVKRLVCHFDGGDSNEVNKRSKSHNTFKVKIIHDYDLV